VQGAGHVTRERSPRDRRSAVVRLSPAIQSVVAEALAPLVAAIDALVKELSEDDAHVVRRFLEGPVDAADRHATRRAARPDATARDALTVTLPALWA
jgi:hypothetical protein